MVLPQIGFDHQRIGLNLDLCSRREHLSVTQHRNDVADCKHDIHVVLDEKNGQLRRKTVDQLDEICTFVRRGSGRRLVHQQDLRLRAKRDGHFKLPLLSVRQLVHIPVQDIMQMHLLGRVVCLAHDIGKRPA